VEAAIRKLFSLKSKEYYSGQALVALTCDPSYSEGRDQEDCGLRPVQANSSAKPYLKKKNPSQKRAGEVAPTSK
jgi:hypothetical protein